MVWTELDLHCPERIFLKQLTTPLTQLPVCLGLNADQFQTFHEGTAVIFDAELQLHRGYPCHAYVEGVAQLVCCSLKSLACL
jgi:hypothetical protein